MASVKNRWRIEFLSDSLARWLDKVFAVVSSLSVSSPTWVIWYAPFRPPPDPLLTPEDASGGACDPEGAALACGGAAGGDAQAHGRGAQGEPEAHRGAAAPHAGAGRQGLRRAAAGKGQPGALRPREGLPRAHRQGHAGANYRRRGPRQGWSTGHKAPRWAAGKTGLPRPVVATTIQA
eukprot:1195081-Prorocentrum_minimum.AAC.2